MMLANSNLISHRLFVAWPNWRVNHSAPVCESGSRLKGFGLLPTFYRLCAITRSTARRIAWGMTIAMRDRKEMTCDPPTQTPKT
jgi:hypothetical protein